MLRSLFLLVRKQSRHPKLLLLLFMKTKRTFLIQNFTSKLIKSSFQLQRFSANWDCFGGARLWRGSCAPPEGHDQEQQRRGEVGVRRRPHQHQEHRVDLLHRGGAADASDLAAAVHGRHFDPRVSVPYFSDASSDFDEFTNHKNRLMSHFICGFVC